MHGDEKEPGKTPTANDFKLQFCYSLINIWITWILKCSLNRLWVAKAISHEVGFHFTEAELSKISCFNQTKGTAEKPF